MSAERFEQESEGRGGAGGGDGDLVRATADGLWCEAGGFHIDPWRAVDRAVITHAHADHARAGMGRYLCASAGAGILSHRVRSEVDSIGYGERVRMGDVFVSLHPAGHVLGSSQVRVEDASSGEVWVVTGDYKRTAVGHLGDRTCAAFELVRCNVLITESTFGLPIYRWPDPALVFDSINGWWRSNVEEGRTSVLYAYALGKAQRLLSGLDGSIGPILLHGSLVRLTELYREAGVELPAAEHAGLEVSKRERGRALVLAPPSAAASPWIRKFLPVSDAFASGWMMVRGMRRRRSVDRGFVMSDHADWDGLLRTIEETGAERVGVTHGFTSVLSRYLRERGLDSFEVATRYVGEEAGEGVDELDGELDEEVSGGVGGTGRGG